MAADYDIVNRSKQHGNNLVRCADLLAEASALISKEYTAANHMNDGVSYSVMVSQFGLDSTVDPANLLTLMGNLQTALAAQGVTEFVARIAGQ